MARNRVATFFCLILILSSQLVSVAAEGPAFTRIEDVIYSRKFGTALTLDVFTPKQNPNGLGVILAVSSGWVSSHESISMAFTNELLKRGFTVFAVVHGSQPKFTIPEAISDTQRAVRFIRHHANDYHVDPKRIAITGRSAGGHLSLMLGTTGGDGDPKAEDPVDRESSRVQAVACFFPPTDFLNYGTPGELGLGVGRLADLRAPFDFTEFDKNVNAFVPVTDAAKIREIGRQISPLQQVTADDAPTLIIHGDADRRVPIQQAESMIARLKEVGVPAEVIVKPRAAHGWENMFNDISRFADWFDKYLK